MSTVRTKALLSLANDTRILGMGRPDGVRDGFLGDAVNRGCSLVREIDIIPCAASSYFRPNLSDIVLILLTQIFECQGKRPEVKVHWPLGLK